MTKTHNDTGQANKYYKQQYVYSIIIHSHAYSLSLSNNFIINCISLHQRLMSLLLL